MDRMNKFTLLRAAIAISSSKIYPIKKEVRKVIAPLHQIVFAAACFPRGSMMIDNRLCELLICTKTCTKVAPLVLL